MIRDNQKGQVVLILVLVMTVALAIGISVVQRSLSDISTASKVEQSSRAFSAAEAGLEQAIQQSAQGVTIVSTFLLGDAEVKDVGETDVPSSSGQAIEYPPLAKEEMAQVWLASPDDLIKSYAGATLGIYWGNEGTDENPAVEVTVIYQDTLNNYRSKKYFLDKIAGSGAGKRENNFDAGVTCPSDAIPTSLSPTVAKTFFCKKDINVDSALPNLKTLILLRARLLYNTTSQPFAVNPTSGNLPLQGTLFTATGQSGNTQRKVQVFRLNKVVPPYFDYAIFSAGDINK